MSRVSEKMPLKILYLIRRAGEISFFDLYKNMFGSEEIVWRTEQNMFLRYLLRLQNEEFISVRIRTKDAAGLPVEREEKDTIEFHKMMRCAFLGPSMPGVDFSGKEESRETIVLSVTEKFELVQHTVGFSVTDEIRQLQAQSRREAILGFVNPFVKSKVFVIMPFAKQFTPIYENHIKAVCDEMGYSCKRADMVDSSSVITNDIWSLICNADIIICDCTGKNANVFYELGLAHAVGKDVICITQNEGDIPFDIAQLRYIRYDDTPDGMKEFEQTLTRYLRNIRQ